MSKIFIIGGGAAGLMAAGIASQICDVTILEKNEKFCKKIYISGKGRCNVTNNKNKDVFFENIVRNRKFFYSSYATFDNFQTVEFFEQLGVKLKLERGGRYFPKSDKANDIITALERFSSNANRIYNCTVNSLQKIDDRFKIETTKGEFWAERVVLATGGKSYASTGSTGDGYKFAEKLGHTIVPCVAALVPIMIKQDLSEIAGLSLKNVRASIKIGKKEFSQFGEMLFMPSGVSGPIILTLSSLINREKINGALLQIDLKPALSQKQLDERVQSDFQKYQNKQFKNSLNDLLPKSLIPLVIKRSQIDGNKAVNIITAQEREKFVDVLKNLTFEIDRLADINAAIVTSGGVDSKEIDPRTMQSKLVDGLYFAGEIIDIDALTGGYNLQIAFSTGMLAGKNVAR